jgi:phage terminase large subunit
MDEGYTNPAVILLVGEDGDGRRHVAREYYQRGVLQSLVCQHALDWQRRHSTETCVVDDSAAGLIAELRAVGVNARAAAKGRVLDGIQLVQDALKVQGDGKARLTVDPSCENLISEFESYRWKATNGRVKDEPEKENDHALDALRYLFGALTKSDYYVAVI